MVEDKKLKCYLVLQSFCPLFILVFIRHASCLQIYFLIRFLSELFRGNLAVIGKSIKSPALGDTIITLLCILCFLATTIVAFGFRNLQYSKFDSYGEIIIVGQEKKDSGAIFLVTFILPLLVDDVSTLRKFVFFIVVVGMVVFLLVRSDLFYQSPVLVALKYRTFEFKFVNPNKDVNEHKTYMGLTKGEIPDNGVCIKRRYIADNIFLIYND